MSASDIVLPFVKRSAQVIQASCCQKQWYADALKKILTYGWNVAVQHSFLESNPAFPHKLLRYIITPY